MLPLLVLSVLLQILIAKIVVCKTVWEKEGIQGGKLLEDLFGEVTTVQQQSSTKSLFNFR